MMDEREPQSQAGRLSGEPARRPTADASEPLSLESARESAFADIQEYLTTRFPLLRFLTLSLFLGLAASTITENWSLQLLAWKAFALILPLVVQHRLWDDLASLPCDRRYHPGRVLCRTTHLGVFRFGLWGLTIANLVLVATGVSLAAAGALMAWLAVLHFVYTRYAQAPWLPFAVLLKYGVFVVVVSVPMMPDAAATIVACAWIACCSVLLFDIYDDETMAYWIGLYRLGFWPPLSWWAAGELLAWQLGTDAVQAGAVFGATVAVTAFGLWMLLSLLSRRPKIRRNIGRFGSFAVSTLWFGLYLSLR